MPSLPLTTRRAIAAAPAALAIVAFGCGSDEADSSVAVTVAPEASSFPAVEGKTIEDLEQGATESGLVAAPTVQSFEAGENRYAFGLFTVNGETVTDGEVAVYAGRPGGKAIGPFPATSTTLETKPAFASLTTTGDPDAATNIYSTDVELTGEGEWRMVAIIREADGSFSFTRMPSAVVGADKDTIPDVGEPAPEIHTPTADDVGGDLSKIDTRQPPSTQHEVDFADVLGKEPIVLSFATPALCSSRVCGPVVDIAEEVKSERPDDAAFIHMEIFKNNTPPNVNEQVAAFNLRTEPWLFVIDADGDVSSRIEGAYSKDELEAAIDKVS